MITVAVDATPLLGQPTGVGVAVRRLLGALPAGDLDLVGYGQTGAGWRRVGALLPPGTRPARGPMPAAAVLRLWGRLDGPVLQWWTGPIDVAHGTNFVVPPARRAARLVTVHDLTPVRYPQLCTPASRRYPELIRRALRDGAAVHTSTRFVADEVCEHFGVDGDRVNVIAWGAPAGSGEPSSGGAPPGRAAGPSGRSAGRDVGPSGRSAGWPPYILGLGTVEPRKDFPLLVRAFDRLAGTHPELELRVVGPEGWAEEDLRVAVRASPYAGRIRRSGWVADPTAVLAGATVLAYPSVYEGFGLVPLEAMAAGVPVVATAAGGVPEVVGDAADLVPVGDVDGLAAALARAVDDDAHRRRLAATGRARVAGFSWETTGAAMAALYRRLAAAGSSRT